MVGREVLLRVEKTAADAGRAAARASTGLHVRDERGIEKVRGVSFDVRAGEIVGIAGVDGNGQTELIDALTGLRKLEAGTGRGRRARRSRSEPRTSTSRTGVGHIPEDRQRRGLVLDFSIAENVALHDFRKPPDSRYGWLYPARLDRARATADQGVRRARRRAGDAGGRASRAATSRR